jgi:hypothetical protein
MIDPVEILKKGTSSLLVPTSTKDASATNFPTVVPDLPSFEHAHDDGKRTLWSVHESLDTPQS